MIYSAVHRMSPLEFLLNQLGPVLTVGFTLWAVFATSLVPIDINIFTLALWVVGSLVFCIATHELGHLVVGLLVHRPVRKILIGSGRTIFTARPGGLRVQVCANLIGGGAVYFSSVDDTSADARILVTAAGPAVNLLTGAVALSALPTGWPWLGTFAVLSLALGAGNLIPSRSNRRSRTHYTDGMQILRMALGRSTTSTFFEGEELSDGARRVTILSIEEAMDSESAQLTELHLLAALDRDPDLHRLLAPAQVGSLTRWAGPPSSVDVRPIRSPVVDEIYKMTFRIGRDLGVTPPNAACLCLALIAVPSALTTRLKESGVSEPALRELAVRDREPSGDARPGGPLLPDLPLDRWGSAADSVLALALRIATVDRAEDTATQHVVAAMVAEPDGRAARALARMGFVLSRHDGAVKPGEARATPPPMTPELQSAVAAALLRTGPTFPAGSGELCLGLADQARSMAALLFATADIDAEALEKQLAAAPREPSEPVGYTPSMRRLWELRASSRFGAGRYAESRADFLVLEQTAPTDAIRAINQNNVAWVSLMSGDALLRADALERSRAALAVNPDQRAFQGTYAFALLETGATEAAAEVLEKVVVDHPRPRDRALTLCLLGMARARLHDTQAALVHIQAAESADPRCALLDRARTEVARPPAAAAAG